MNSTDTNTISFALINIEHTEVLNFFVPKHSGIIMRDDALVFTIIHNLREIEVNTNRKDGLDPEWIKSRNKGIKEAIMEFLKDDCKFFHPEEYFEEKINALMKPIGDFNKIADIEFSIIDPVVDHSMGFYHQYKDVWGNKYLDKHINDMYIEKGGDKMIDIIYSWALGEHKIPFCSDSYWFKYFKKKAFDEGWYNNDHTVWLKAKENVERMLEAEDAENHYVSTPEEEEREYWAQVRMQEMNDGVRKDEPLFWYSDSYNDEE